MTIEPKSTERKQVLVVDDEPEVTYALQAYFLGKGYKMLTALDGIQAMKHLRQHSIDLVLLDMKMPGVNGIEVLKFIHAQNPLTKIIVVTAYDVQYQELVERLGVDGFLIKPFGIEAMTSMVQRTLTERPEENKVAVSEEPSSKSGPQPKARLLLVEPSEYTYKLKEVFFSDPDQCGGAYEVTAAYSAKEALEQLEKWHPDILLVDLTLLGPAGSLATQAMSSGTRPKDLIIHGSGLNLQSDQNAKMEDLSKQGVRVVYNESFTRAGLLRLSEVVRKVALTNGLTA